MSAIAELEQLLRRIVREEIAKTTGSPTPAEADDDADLQRRAIETVAKVRRARGGR